MGYQRDPVSEQFDAAAARLLNRAHARRGQWVGTYVKNPSPQWQAWARRRGMNLLGPDNAATKSGVKRNARTRWCRAFVRSVYYLHKHYYYEGKGLDLGDKKIGGAEARGSRALQFEVGTVRINPEGLVVGRPVRIRLLPKGSQADKAVRKLPNSRRIVDDEGNAAGAWNDPTLRDW
jgi:hypothetical protein